MSEGGVLRKSKLISGGLLALSAIVAWGISSVAADPVRAALNQGRADDALQALDSTLAEDAADAEARNLRCRVYYQEEAWDRAIADCEAAVRLDPSRSNYHLWLGRAFGQKAQHVTLFTAYKLARRVSSEFQQAVELDPNNADALADLGEYDVEAPSVVGGGVSRAEALVPQLSALSPSAALDLEARIAESRHDYAAAEADYKSAIAQSLYPAGAWMDLASFYRRRGRLDDMSAAAHTGASLDSRHGTALVDGASSLTAAQREPQVAIQWLELYLNSRAQTEDAPSFVVRAKLARLLAEQGDDAGAQQQLAAARAVASGYRAAVTGHASGTGR
jgi:tetratricopeptide (TPR) repeat protein